MNKRFKSALITFILTGLIVITISCSNSTQIAVKGAAATPVGGYISEDTTWAANNSPYEVTQDVIVEEGVLLSLEPGVEVRFSNQTELVVDGALNATGTSVSPIIFTSNATTPMPGDWQGIYFREGAEDSLCVMNWTIVNYAYIGVVAHASSPLIQNSRFEYNSHFGIESVVLFAFGDIALPILQNCTFTHNGGFPDGGGHHGGIYATASGFINIENCAIEDNVGNGVDSNSGRANVTRSIIRNNMGTGVMGNVVIKDSEITGNNQSGASIYGEVHYNSIYDNSPYDLVATEDVNATFNWWGTTNETLIEEHIFDYYDDYDIGKVTYKPHISSPYFVCDYEQIYEVQILSNSSITDFSFSKPAKSITFNANGTTGTPGFCNITIPAELMSGTFTLYKDDTQLVEDADYTETYNETHYIFKIFYNHSIHTIKIVSTQAIPELPTNLVTLLTVMSLSASTLFFRKKILRKNSKLQ